jgi:hypothetical protein
MDIGTLTGSLELEDKLSGALNSVVSKVKDFGSNVNSTNQTASDSFKGLESSITQAFENPMGAIKDMGRGIALSVIDTLGGVGIAVGVATVAIGAFGLALYGLAKSAASVGGDLDDMADKTGMSVPALSHLSNAAKVAGSDLNTLTNATFMLERNMGKGGAAFEKALGQIGLSTEELKNVGPDNYLTTIAAGLSKIEDPSLRAAAGNEILGRSYKEVAATLQDLGTAMELTADIEPWTKEQAADAEKFEMQMASLWVHAEALATQLGKFLIPAVSGTVEVLKTVANLMFKDVVPAFKAVMSAWNSAAAAVRYFKGESEKIPEITGSAKIGVEKLQASVSSLAVAFYKPGDERSVGAAFAVAESASKDLATTHGELTKKQNDAAAAAKKAAAEHLKFTDSVKNLTSSAVGAVAGFGAFGRLMPDLSDKAGKFRETLDNLDSSQNEFHNGMTVLGDTVATTTIPLFTTLGANVLPKAAAALDEVHEAARHTSSTLKNDLMNVLKSIPQTVANAFTGGGGMLGAAKAIGSQFGSLLGEKLGAGIKSLGALGGPIGAAIGSLAGPIIGFFANVFSGGAEHLINPIRQGFIDMAGGLGALNERAHAAGVTLTALLDAKNPEAYKKAIDDLNAAFNFQDSAMKTLDDTAAKYGLTLADMGPKYRQGKLDEQFLTLFQDQQVLAAGGVDYDLILQKQAGSYQSLIDMAMLTGATIPEQMRLPLQRMAELGLLTDDSGEKMTDLTKLTFAETLDSKFKTLIDTIGKLVDAIANKLGTALNNVPHPPAPWSDWGNPPMVDGDWNRASDTSYAAMGGRVTSNGVQYLASGGSVLNGPWMARGTDTEAAMLTPGEGVVTVAGMQRIGNEGLKQINHGGFGGDDTSAELAALRTDYNRLLLQLPNTMIRAMRYENQKTRKRA